MAQEVRNRILVEAEKLRPELVKLTQELIRAKSVNPPGDEREPAEVLRRYLSAIGLKTEVVEAGPNRLNVIAGLNGTGGGKTILFNGHTDVVPVSDPLKWTVDPFSGEVRDDRIYGRGASDMKGALASVTIGIHALVSSSVPLRGNVVFHAVADEEVASKYGTKYLVNNGYAKADAAVVMEGSVFGGKIAVRPAVRGTCWVRLRTFGRAAHASRPNGGVNAVVNMARLLLALKELRLEHKPHKYLPAPTISPGTVISGGVKTNVIPDLCEADCDIRLIPGMKAEDVLERIRELIDTFRKNDSNFSAEVELLNSSLPAELPEDAPILGVVRNATKAVVGYEPQLKGGYGSNDSQYLINYARIPAVCGFGPGDSETGNAHGADESVSTTAMMNFAKIYALTVVDFCGTT